MLYKYPHAEFPYRDLVATNAGRSRQEMEYELIDTGVFADDRYFDVEVEYAKAEPRRHRMQDHDPQPRSGGRTDPRAPDVVVPEHVVVGAIRSEADACVAIRTAAPWWPTITQLGPWYLHVEPDAESAVLRQRDQRRAAVGTARTRPSTRRTRSTTPSSAAATTPSTLPERAPRSPRTPVCVVPAGSSAIVRLRLDRSAPGSRSRPPRRRRRRDRHAAAPRPTSSTPRSRPPACSADAANVMRQALAGMLWSKQCYFFDVDQWLRERGRHPLRPPGGRGTRNESWFHMANHDVISMPDTWEYPWYAAWDLAFHTVPLMMVDPDFAKQQLSLMLSPRYLHPTGQIPAYEWNFGDVNPPVHAFATLLVHTHAAAGAGDRRGRSRVPEGVVRSAAHELHVVGESQGSVGAWPVRGRFPRARQHRGVRSQRGAPHRRAARAGRRHGLDGDVQPEHARVGADARRARSRPTSRTCWSSSSASSGSPPPSIRSATIPTRSGTRRRASSTTCCACPTGAGVRLQVRSVVGLLPMCATAIIEPQVLERFPELRSRAAAVPGSQRRPDRQRPRPAPAGRRRAPPAVARRRDQAAPDPRAHARRGTLPVPARHPFAVALASRHPYEFDVHGQTYRVAVRAGRVDDRDVRRQLELARAGVVPGQPADRPGPAPALPVLRRRVHDRVPDRIGPAR